jgi:hypothetical protein
LSQSLTAMKTYWGSGGIAPRILTSALDGGEWSASSPGRFTPREGAPLTHRLGGLVGLRAVLDAVMKRKIPSPCRESSSRTLIVQPVVQRYTDSFLQLNNVSYVAVVTMCTICFNDENSTIAHGMCLWVSFVLTLNTKTVPKFYVFLKLGN